MGWTRDDASHLLLRAGMGGSLQQIEALYAMGRWSAVEYMLQEDIDADPAWEAVDPLGAPASASRQREEVLTLLYRLLRGTRPLQSRLTWFWLDHFTPAVRQAGRAPLEAQARALRAHAIGPYKAFLPALYRGGVIDGHLVGAGLAAPVSDQALLRRTVARARVDTGGDTMVVSPPKVAPADDAARLVRRLFDRPETMREVCVALHRTLVSPFADAPQMSRLCEAWRSSGGRIAAVLRVLLHAPVFWDARVRGALVKGPLEYAAGLVQRLDLQRDRVLLSAVADSLARAGHWLLRDPDTDACGEAPARSTDAAGLMQRYAFARQAVFGIDPEGVARRLYAALPRRMTPQVFITLLAQRMGVAGLGAQTRALMTDHLGPHEVAGAQDERVLDALYLLVCSPEYQRC